jgi:hypothetical protein
MIDQSVESQVAGRGHRLGRTSPLNIWYLAYDNEYADLKVSHGIREMTVDDLAREESKAITVLENSQECNLGGASKGNTSKSKSKSHDEDDEKNEEDGDEEDGDEEDDEIENDDED